MSGWVYATKTADRNDLKLGTIVVRETMLQHTDFGFTRAMVRVQGLGLGLGSQVSIYISRECTIF